MGLISKRTNMRKKVILIVLVSFVVLVAVNWWAYKHTSVWMRLGSGLSRTDLHWAAWDGRTSAVKRLLAKGADVNARDKHGDTPLCDAVFRGHKRTVEVLIANGADVNTRDSYLSTPLHAAVGGGYVEIVKMLLEAGADPTARDKRGSTPADLAMSLESDRIVRFFMGRKLRACVEVLRAHTSVPLSIVPSTATRKGMVITPLVFLMGFAVNLVGYIWIVVIAFKKDIYWGFGCFLAPVNFVFAIFNWDECRRPLLTIMAGFGICFAGVLLGPMLDGLRMMFE
ncbi:MAG: ankyrin repeat domain-containing protein [Sedimentisphaerales bacterium]|nr:ankyrin repeat domain-containing protein [Sedimentisphaerales bacterium]